MASESDRVARVYANTRLCFWSKYFSGDVVMSKLWRLHTHFCWVLLHLRLPAYQPFEFFLVSSVLYPVIVAVSDVEVHCFGKLCMDLQLQICTQFYFVIYCMWRTKSLFMARLSHREIMLISISLISLSSGICILLCLLAKFFFFLYTRHRGKAFFYHGLKTKGVRFGWCVAVFTAVKWAL